MFGLNHHDGKETLEDSRAHTHTTCTDPLTNNDVELTLNVRTEPKTLTIKFIQTSQLHPEQRQCRLTTNTKEERKACRLRLIYVFTVIAVARKILLQQ